MSTYELQSGNVPILDVNDSTETQLFGQGTNVSVLDLEAIFCLCDMECSLPVCRLYGIIATAVYQTEGAEGV